MNIDEEIADLECQLKVLKEKKYLMVDKAFKIFREMLGIKYAVKFQIFPLHNTSKTSPIDYKRYEIAVNIDRVVYTDAAARCIKQDILDEFPFLTVDRLTDGDYNFCLNFTDIELKAFLFGRLAEKL